MACSSRPRVAITSCSADACRLRTSRSPSALADPPPLPWLYPYKEDPSSLRLGGPLYRPFVPIALANGDQVTFQLTGLIDTGADSVLASDYLADQLGVDLDDHEGETTLGVGGHVVAVRYKTVSLRLYPKGEDDVYIDRSKIGQQAPVGSSRTGTAMASFSSAASASSISSRSRRAASPRPLPSKTGTPSTSASARSPAPEPERGWFSLPFNKRPHRSWYVDDFLQ